MDDVKKEKVDMEVEFLVLRSKIIKLIVYIEIERVEKV